MARRRRSDPTSAPAKERVRRVGHVLLASEGRPFSVDALAATVLLAQQHGARVTVLTIMRIWGTGMGMPNPGLLPNKREVADARSSTQDAITYLRKRDIDVSGESIGTRRPSKVILREAAERHCDVIVMGADGRGRIGDFSWRNEPYRVALRAPVPVYLVKAR